MDMQVRAALEGNSQQLGQLANDNIAQASEKLKNGDIEGATQKLEQAVNALKDASKGAEKGEPPGQKLSLEDLLKALEDIIEQGKKQSAESPANQATHGGQESKGGENAQKGGISDVLALVMQLLQQMGGASEPKAA